MNALTTITAITSLALLAACASKPKLSPMATIEELYHSESQFSAADYADKLYNGRTWVAASELDRDTIELATSLEASQNDSRVKIIGPDYDNAIHSLATKLWMIDNAKYTLDLTYYIYSYDLAGHAILGALCNAVERGVDVRIMVDSLGSIHPTHTPIRALESCAENAGFVVDAKGNKTLNKARVQFVVINAITSVSSWSNRRSHDKLIIKDGMHAEDAMVMTGGRNISLHYYGIDANGDKDPDTFLDLEMLLRSPEHIDESTATVGEVSSVYYSLLFLHKGNRRLYPVESEDDDISDYESYADNRKKSAQALEQLMAIPSMAKAYQDTPTFIEQDLSESKVRLVHELGNFITKDTVNDAKLIKQKNVNSIEGLLDRAFEQAERDGHMEGTFRIVSPYLFIPSYKNKQGEVSYDGAELMKQKLAQYPNINFEIITNSVLTSDNYFTQSVIDMDTAPRLLLTDEQQAQWLSSRETGELNTALVNSEQWQKSVNNPRIKIYQTGMQDARNIGGDVDYGKLHAKFFFSETTGYVGTSNFDYRSRLYNNEMGFYFHSMQTSKKLLVEFDKLKAISLRWGSPEWLDMRKQLVASKDKNAGKTESQVKRYKRMKKSGLIWLF